MKVNTEKKEEANFFFEKVLQRFNPRTLIKKPKRGENPSDPTYYLIDYLARKKKVTVEDLWEMKNPSARLAKAAITIRTSSKAAKDSQKVQYETIEQVEDFMKDTGMWSKEEIKKLGEHDEDNSEDENLGEVEKQIREIILTKIQNSQKYHKSFEALMREALASNLRKVQSRTNIPFLMKNFPGTRERTSSWNKTGRLYDSHAPLVKEYIKNTPSSERRQFDDTLFIKYFLEVFEDPSELLGLEPGTCYLKDLRQVLIDLYGEKKVPLNLFTDGLNGTGNLALEAMMTATQEASQQKTQGLGVEADISEPSTPELILRSNSPSNLKVLMSGLNKYKREAIRNIVQEEKLDYAETQRIKKVIYQTKKTQLTNQEGIENSSKSSKKSLEKSKDQSIVSSKSKRQGIARFNSKIYNGDSEKKSRADRIRRNNILNTIDNKIDLMSNNDPEMLRNVKGSFKRQLEAQSISSAKVASYLNKKNLSKEVESLISKLILKSPSLIKQEGDVSFENNRSSGNSIAKRFKTHHFRIQKTTGLTSRGSRDSVEALNTERFHQVDNSPTQHSKNFEIMTSSLDETRNQKMFNRTSTSPIKNFNFRKVHDKESISNTVLNSPIKKYPNKSAFRLYTFTNSHTRKSSKDLSQKMIRIEGLTKDVSHSRKTSEKNLKSSLTHKNASVNQFKHGSKLFGDQKWALDTISNLTKMIEDKITSKTPTNRAIIPSKIQEIDHKDKQLKIDDQSQTIEQQKALNTIKMRKKYQEEVTEIYMRLIADKKRAMSKIVDNLMQRHTEEVE